MYRCENVPNQEKIRKYTLVYRAGREKRLNIEVNYNLILNYLILN